jgi:hypothetical protein
MYIYSFGLESMYTQEQLFTVHFYKKALQFHKKALQFDIM